MNSSSRRQERPACALAVHKRKLPSFFAPGAVLGAELDIQVADTEALSLAPRLFSGCLPFLMLCYGASTNSII